MDASNATARTTRAAALTGVLLLAQMAVLLGVAAPVAAQASGPTIAGIAFVDTDADGLIDGAVIRASEPVLGASVRPGDFQFQSVFTSFGTLDDERFGRTHIPVPQVARDELQCGSTVAVTGSPVMEPAAPASLTVSLDPAQDRIDATGHNLALGTVVTLSAADGSLPSELSPQQVYYVIDADSDGNANSFELSESPPNTAGGATLVQFSSAGTGTISVHTGYGACFGIGFTEHHFWSSGGVLGSSVTSGSAVPIFPDTYFTSRVLETALGSLVSAPAHNQVPGKFGGAQATDAAPPVMLAASGAPGDNEITAIYSEQLSNEGSAPAADLVYTYTDAGNQIQNAAVVHVASSRAIEVPLTSTLGTGDVGTQSLTPTGSPTLADTNGLDQRTIGRTLATPEIISAHADLARPDKVILTFNMPVQSVAAGAGGATQLTEADFFPMQTGAQGNTLAVQRVEHRLGSATAVLTVNPPISSGDIAQGAETMIRPRLDRITALGDPDNRMDSVTPTDEGKEPIQPRIKPRIESATARDLDSNGFLDVIEIKFNKPLQDGTKPGGGGGTSLDTNNLRAAQWRIVVNERGSTGGADLDGTLSQFSVITKGGQNVAGCSIETSLAGSTDDDTIFLCWNQGNYNDATGVCTGFCLGTGAQLSVDYSPPVPADQNADQVKDAHENIMDAYRGFAARDAAPPILMRAETMDLVSTATTLGRIDAYRLTFSEPVDGGSSPQAGWTVQNRQMPNNAMTGSGSTWTLKFDEIEFGTDTAATPQVTYTPGTNRWKDFFGNDLLTVNSGDVTEVDGAAPILVRIEGEIGSSLITFQFSEGVRELPNGAAIDPQGTLEYLNEGPGAASAPVPGTFTHNAGAASATWRLNAPMESADLATGAHDKVQILSDPGAVQGCPTACSNIIESSSAALVPQTVAPGTYRIVPKPTVAQDSARPDNPANLALAPGVTPNPTHSTVVVTFDESHDDIGPVSYILAYSESVIDTVAKFNAASKASVTQTRVEAGTVTLTATNLPSEKTLYLAVQARDAAGKVSQGIAWMTDSITTPAEPVDPNAPDTDPPERIDDLATTSVTANSFVITFTPPSDNRGVTGYSVKVASSSFTDFTDACTATTCPDALPAGITVGSFTQSGGKVSMKVSGLDPDTTYYVSVRAFDAALNPSPASDVKTATTGTDSSAPPAPTNVRTVPETGIIEFQTVTASWSAVTDEQSDVTGYYWAVNNEETYTVGPTDDFVQGTTVTLNNLAEGTNWFHVAAQSAGGTGAPGRVRIEVGPAPPELTTNQIKQTNSQFIESVRRSGGDVEVSWTEPADPPAAFAGVQIWCVSDDGSSQLLQTIEEGTGQYRAKRYVDRGATCDGSYVVTGFYQGGVGQGSEGEDVASYVNDPQSEGAAVEAAEGVLELEPWMILALAGATILILVAILFFVLRGRGKSETQQVWQDEEPESTETWESSQEETWQQEETPQAWDAGADEPAWADEPGDEPAWADEPGDEPTTATDASDAADAAAPAGAAAAATAASTDADAAEVDDTEVHQVTCPECNEVFVAEGRRPLRIECPNCGVQGML